MAPSDSGSYANEIPEKPALPGNLFKTILKHTILNPKNKVMNKHKFKTICFALLTWIIALTGAAQQPVFPVKVSDNGRYITDQNNKAVFWLGTTQWQIFRDYTLNEARIIY